MSSATSRLILQVQPLQGQLPCLDPFLFGAYHQDHYPPGNGALAPDPALLRGRDIGMDFSGQQGWSMYHGDAVPGFPAHPHRGFETVTIVRQGLVDHADSLGASARYGQGDVQWLTTGRGVQHGEMFPLVHEDQPNTLDLFQLWLNLPAKSKMVAPDFTMFWGQDIPRVSHVDAAGRRTDIEIVAGDYRAVDPEPDGTLQQAKALRPPTHSWASEPGTDVAIWILRLAPGARLTLPPATPVVRRALYLTTGSALRVDAQRFDQRVMLELAAAQPVPLTNESDATMEVLLLQGRPIGEPVAARGPIVMNTAEEVQQAIRDYQRTEFGGWPWESPAQTFGLQPRFAKHPDGRLEQPEPPR